MSVGTAGVPEVSVIIPFRDASEYLAEQLSALSRQQWIGRWEVIAVDNGSTDSSVDVAASFEKHLPALKLVRAHQNPGIAAARNAGAAAATGDCLLFLDADDEVAPGYLAAMGTALTQHSFVAARMDNKALNAPWARRSRRSLQDEGLAEVFGFLPWAHGGSLGIRREVFDRLGGFPAGLPTGTGDDVDFCWRAQLAGVELAFVPDATVRYRYRQELPAVFRQGRTFGRAAATRFQRFRGQGMPRYPMRESVLRWPRLAPLLTLIRNRGDLARWLFECGYAVGLLQGSLHARVLYL